MSMLIYSGDLALFFYLFFFFSEKRGLFLQLQWLPWSIMSSLTNSKHLICSLITSTEVIADRCFWSYEEQLLIAPQGRVEILELLCYNPGLHNERARQLSSKATQHQFRFKMSFNKIQPIHWKKGKKKKFTRAIFRFFLCCPGNNVKVDGGNVNNCSEVPDGGNTCC